EEAEVLRERSLLIHRALAYLPPTWRQALLLADVHGMRESEVADILGQTSEQLQRLRNCAEFFMRDWLSQYLSGEELIPEQANTADLLGSPLREALPDELRAEILEKIMPLE
ncbi:sigma factor-like helix-turn-helix DNA-binding protein, partial [Thiolapillus sp.]